MSHTLIPWLGILGASMFAILVLLNGRLVLRQDPCGGALLIIIVAGSLLSTQAWTGFVMTPHVVMGLLLLGSVYALIKVDWQKPKLLPRDAWLFGMALFLLLVAAVPSYRYDQLNYHLVISKYLQLNGALPPLVFDDHLYFTGGYEFVFGLFRLFSDHDIVIQSLVNSFSLLFFALLMIGAMYRGYGGTLRARDIILLALTCVLFVPHFEVATNSKPDLLLMAAGFYCLSYFPSDNDRRHSFIFGLLMTVPLGLKITWLAFASALGLVFVVNQIRQKHLASLSSAIKGSLLGFLLIALPFYKTWHFLGNPLHPVQAGFLRSTVWSSDVSAHWSGVALKVTSVLDWIYSVPLAGLDYLVLTKEFVLLGLAFILASFVYKVSWLAREKDLKTVKISLMALGLYLLLWPLIFGKYGGIMRFKEASYSFILPLVIMAGLNLKKGQPRAFYSLMIVSLLASSSFDVYSLRIAKYYQADGLSSYFQDNRTYALKIYNISEIINEHREKHHAGAAFSDHIVLANTPMKYFLNMNVINSEGYTFTLAVQKAFLQESQVCTWDILSQFNVNYLFDFNYLKIGLDPIYREMIKHGEKLSDRYEIYYFSDSLIQENRAKYCHKPKWHLSIRTSN